MHIQSINNSQNNPSMKAGLYFTKKSNVLFNKNNNVNFLTDDIVKTSKDGFRYIEDTSISQSVKDRFAEIPFIKSLAEKFDTFIFFREMPKGSKNNFSIENFSFTKISWADETKNHAQQRIVNGSSPISQEFATNKMFTNLEHNNFCNIA